MGNWNRDPVLEPVTLEFLTEFFSQTFSTNQKNSHPDQTIVRDPPMQFQNEQNWFCTNS